MIPAMRRGVRVLAVLFVAGCGEADPEEDGGAVEPAVAFRSARACIVTATDTLPLTVEMAETEEQRAYGLMERDQLPANAGMIFTYAEPQPAESEFWMFRTRIPLDIAFLGPEGEIRATRTMQPCPSPDSRWCDGSPAGVEFSAALEVNQGYFEQHGVRAGDRVLWKDPERCPQG